MLPERQTAATEEPVELAPDEAEAVGLFFALDTQWRRHAMTGSRLGLDYASIEPTARMLSVPMRPQLLSDLRAMEGAALEVLAAKK